MLVMEGYGDYGKFKMPKIGKKTFKSVAIGAALVGGAYAVGKAGGPMAAAGKLKSGAGGLLARVTRGKTGMAALTEVTGRLPKKAKERVAAVVPEAVAMREMAPIEPIVEAAKPAVPGWIIPAAIAAIGGFFMLRG